MILAIIHRVIAMAIGVVLFEGARRERLAALIMAGHLLLYELVFNVSYLDANYSETVQYALSVLLEAALMGALAWLAWRRPERWLLALLAVQAISLATWGWTALVDGGDEPLHRGGHVLIDALRTAILLRAAAATAFARPRSPPPPDLDIDLCQTASDRWPQAVAKAG